MITKFKKSIWLLSGLLHYVVWWKFTDDSEVLAAFIIMALKTDHALKNLVQVRQTPLNFRKQD
jgi:hypothetical protein